MTSRAVQSISTLVCDLYLDGIGSAPDGRKRDSRPVAVAGHLEREGVSMMLVSGMDIGRRGRRRPQHAVAVWFRGRPSRSEWPPRASARRRSSCARAVAARGSPRARAGVSRSLLKVARARSPADQGDLHQEQPAISRREQSSEAPHLKECDDHAGDDKYDDSADRDPRKPSHRWHSLRFREPDNAPKWKERTEPEGHR